MTPENVPTSVPASVTESGTRVAVVTGAGSGIGAATARALAADGFHVVCAARRVERIAEVAAEISGTAVACDVTDADSVAALAQACGPVVHVLVNNAGGAFGNDPVESADPEQWKQMFDVNVVGLLRVTQALLPALRASGDALIVTLGSVAGRVVYENGAGYVAAKHGAKAVTQTLRLELCGEPVRISEVAPGMVHTPEFSLVRYGGDQSAADAVYDGVPDPLVAEDIAETVRWIASLPAHVNVDELVVRPRAQAANHKVHRVTQD
ncbi:SDR family oxidoreductase [Nocardioides daphniae]|uniref:Oxidoreductase n=1 Tax=Nocardioides daphniae TaxID=402297 RepID=A0A4P7U8P4_9ACTN|nr:SDR family oxidoreductase [Nocardioides daphniae]QCC76512.1 SDR family oxidoreductase [Nocardioides daphniae]GGD05964.1 oxidoreductase [Nocardioides daphniae]